MPSEKCSSTATRHGATQSVGHGTRTLSSIWSSTVHSRFCACRLIPVPKWVVRKLNKFPTQSNFRLLVVRLGAMGDILHALPAVTSLRQAHPSWQIGWVVDPRWQALLKAGAEGTREQGTEKARAQGQGTPVAKEGPGSAMPVRDSAMPVVDRLHCFDACVEAASADREDRSRNQDVAQRAARRRTTMRSSTCRAPFARPSSRAWPAAHAALARPSRASGPRSGCLPSA